MSRKDAKSLGLIDEKKKQASRPDYYDDVVPIKFCCHLSTIWIPGWYPAPLNKLMGRAESYSGKLKRNDLAVVAASFMASGILRATGRRRVDLHIVLACGKRRPDKDGQWKSVLDALTHCGAILGDSPNLLMQGKVSFSRAEEFVGEHPVYGTFVIIEDLE